MRRDVDGCGDHRSPVKHFLFSLIPRTCRGKKYRVRENYPVGVNRTGQDFTFCSVLETSWERSLYHAE